jgi:hypothetical protein
LTITFSKRVVSNNSLISSLEYKTLKGVQGNRYGLLEESVEGFPPASGSLVDV